RIPNRGLTGGTDEHNIWIALTAAGEGTWAAGDNRVVTDGNGNYQSIQYDWSAFTEQEKLNVYKALKDYRSDKPAIVDAWWPDTFAKTARLHESQMLVDRIISGEPNVLSNARGSSGLSILNRIPQTSSERNPILQAAVAAQSLRAHSGYYEGESDDQIL